MAFQRNQSLFPLKSKFKSPSSFSTRMETKTDRLSVMAKNGLLPSYILSCILRLISAVHSRETIHNYFSWANMSKGGKGTMRLTPCKAPTRETKPDRFTGNSVSYSLRQVCGFFKVPTLKMQQTGPTCLSSLSEKTHASNHL